MTPAPAGSEPAGFVSGRELWLFLLGVVATLIVIAITVWLVRQMQLEDRDRREHESGRDRPEGVGGPDDA